MAGSSNNLLRQCFIVAVICNITQGDNADQIFVISIVQY